MNKDGTKKQRGSNYTLIEQTTLLELIKKHVEIIENKETNAVVSSKKRTAWNAIAQRYNAMAVTGPRNWIQLRNLYENLKQRKKRQIRKERQQLCIKKINELNKKISSDMKELSCTDDDAYNTSAMTENEKWIQAMVSPKMKTRQFGIELTVSGDDMETITVPAQPPFIVKHEIEEDSTSAAGSNKDFSNGDDMENITAPAQPSFIVKHEIEEDSFSAAGSSKKFPDDISKKKPPENEISCSSAKEEYYKLKLSNAKLERNFLLQRHKMEKEKLALELEILHLKRQKLL